jgi:hypothetical protein
MIFLLCVIGIVAAETVFAAGTASASTEPITFNKDILPILQANCQTCHRPGEIGPMPFLTYEGTRPWAKAIKAAVISRKMPPWFADPKFGHWANDRSLRQEDIDKLTTWVDNGAPEGDTKDRPAPIQWTEGWVIPKPDLTVEMPVDYKVPAKGTIEYTYMIVPTGFTEDKWVQFMEVRPGNRALVHHANIYIRRPGSKWLREYPVNVPFVPTEQKTSSSAGAPLTDENIAGFTPGKQTVTLSGNDAKLIPAGSDIVFQIHYTTNGQEGVDRTKIGFVFAKNAPEQRVARIFAANATFTIPPGAPDYKVEAVTTLQTETTLVSLKPHMHLRGKAMEFRVVYTGEKEILLNIPHYDFNWQTECILDKPMVLPKGARLEVTAIFDNSANNKFNPDATSVVKWGDQSWEEMAIGYFEVGFPTTLDLNDVVALGAEPSPD